MIKLGIKHNFHLLESTLLAMASDLAGEARDIALTRTAAAARRDVMAKLPGAFDRPTPFTVRSIRYKPAHDGQTEVYISDDAAKGLSPRKYLGPEITGGARDVKRSERALIARGLMEPDQRLVPGRGATLDRYGNIPGPRMVTILSALGAHGEQGYQMNATARTKRRKGKLGVATRATGTPFFIGKSKRDGGPGAVYQLISRGIVRPVLWFVRREPDYKPRFDFHGLVGRSAAAHWPGEMMKAFRERLAKHTR
jgi:hypothetical protein